MEQKAGAQISKRSFIQAVVILFVLMMMAGVLTLLIPAGQYARTEIDGREVIDPASFQFIPKPAYPIWRWFTAPLEVLAGPNALTLITIILFLLMVGASFAVLEHSGVIKDVLGRLVARWAYRASRPLIGNLRQSRHRIPADNTRECRWPGFARLSACSLVTEQ